MAAPVVGLTGGIASGKSEVARRFERRGARVVDADALAREVVARGTPGLRRVVEAFGQEVLQSDGNLDRKALATMVFENTSQRRRLNAITHPLIAGLAASRVAELQHDGPPYVVYEAALIVEAGAHRDMDALVVVSVDEHSQMARLRARDGLPQAEAEARIRSQAPLQDKLAVADYVIDNGGSLAELETQVERVHRHLLKQFEGRVTE